MQLVVKSATDLKSALDAIIDGIDTSLAAKRDGGSHVLPPEDLKISGIMLLAYDDGVDVVETTADEHEITTTEITPTHNVVITTVAPSQTTTTNETPPNRTTTRVTNGGDTVIVDREYKQEDEI